MADFVALPLFSLAKDWIPSLIRKLSDIRSTHDGQMDALADILRGDPIELARNYIQPDCQQFNPADSTYEDDVAVVRQPIFDRLEQFAGAGSTNTNQMMVLADAGMGKTSLLVMFTLGYLNSFWPSPYDCLLLKLGRDTLSKIAAVKDRRKTVLLLDALDEDPIGWGRAEPRLHEILSATGPFHRVIITCRTQFFSGGEDPFERRGFVRTGGYSVPVVYLSAFSPQQVNEYLMKRFPHHLEKRERAERMLAKMHSLRSRPMLLAHVEDLLVSEKHDWTEFSVYAALVSAWLMREEKKARERNDDDVPTAENLLDVCHKIAWKLHTSNVSDISDADLTTWIFSDPSLGLVRGIDIRGRSLLNRTSRGNFRFSHLSVQEFLVVDAMLRGRFPQSAALNSIRVTGLMLTFILATLGKGSRDTSVLRQLELTNKDFSRANMSGLDLSGLNLTGSKLEDTVLSDAILKGSVLTRCQAARSRFRAAGCEGLIANDADLKNADMRGASLNDASFSRADLRGAVLAGANLQRVIMVGADLRDVDFSGADLRHADLTNARTDNATWTGAQLEGAKRDLRVSKEWL